MKKIIPLFTILLAIGLTIAGLAATKMLNFQKNAAGKIGLIRPGQETETDKTNETKNKTVENISYAEHLTKGDELAEKEHYTLAFNEYVLANKLNPDATEPLLKIGKLHLQRKDTAKAREIFQHILAKNSNDLEANINLGRTYILEEKAEKALEIFNSIAEKNTLISYYKGLLNIYFENYETGKQLLAEILNGDASGDLKKNAENFLKSFEIFSASQGGKTTYLKTLLGKNFNEAEEYDLAIPVLFNVVKEKKDYRDAWILLGYAYLNKNDAKNAIAALEEGKKLDPYKAESLFFLGMSYQLDGQKEKAIELIKDALEKGFEPKIQGKQKLAELYLETGNYEKAAEKYEEVIEINSDDLEYFIRPLWLYIDKTKNAERALKMAQKAIEKHPEKAMSFNLLGWALLANKDYEGAKENLTKALEKDPALSGAYLNFGKLFEEIGYLGTAKDYYKKAFELGKGTSIGDTGAERYNAIMEKENLQANITAKNANDGTKNTAENETQNITQ